MSEIILTDKNFKQEINESSGVAVVDFWAEWCGPCKMIAPIIEEIAKEFEGKVKVCKVNVDENQKLASEFNIMAIPTIVFFKNGKPVERSVGFQSKQNLIKKINQLLETL
jgi:thioredoxin 1